MVVTVEGTVSEDGAIRVESLKLVPGTRVKVSVEQGAKPERRLGDPGSMQGTGRVVGDIVSPIDDWGEA